MTFLHRVREVARRTAGSLAVTVIMVTAIGLIVPAASGQPQEVERENVTLEGSLTDAQFLAGRSVLVRANVADDVFAAGRDVTLESATVRNAIVAGYDVEQRGGTLADMIAAAANIIIAGTVEDDLTAATRALRISTDGSVGGDVRVAAETVDIEGRVSGNVRVAARRVTVAGEVGGKLDLLAERIVIAPTARISGDLIYRSGAAPEVAEGAVIGGEARKVDMEMPDMTSIGLAILGIGLVIAFSWIIATLLLVVILQAAFPGFIGSATEGLRAHPWSNLGRGIAVFLLAAGVAGLLFASILGIPLGGAVLTAMSVVLPFGMVTASYFVGLLIGRRRGSDAEIGVGGRIGWTILGAAVLGLIGVIPIVGGIVAGLAVAAGFGAATAELWKCLRMAEALPVGSRSAGGN